MASVPSLLALAIVVAGHTIIAAVSVRFFRVRMSTRIGAILYALTLVPLLLLASTLVLTGPLGIGAPVGGKATAVFLTIVVPASLGLAIDFVWMPAPDEVTLPDAME